MSQNVQTEITTVSESYKYISACDLRLEASRALAFGGKVVYYRRGEYNSQCTETLVINDGRAGSASGGDAKWGEWSPDDETINLDNGHTIDLDGECAGHCAACGSKD